MIEKKIKENSEHFCIQLVCYFFNAKWNRSRWENLDRGQYRFQPIKFVNSLVPSPCETQPYNKSLYFSIGKITTAALMHSFRVWYVQCLAKRLTLNLIEFIQSKVWRSFDSLALKNVMKNWTTTTSAARLQNLTAFVSKVFSGKFNFRSRD